MIKTGNVKFCFILKVFLKALLLMFISLQALAGASVRVDLQPEAIGVGDTLQAVITIQSSEDIEAEDPVIKPVDGLKLLQASNGGQSSSTRMNFVNGQTEFSKTVEQRFLYFFQVNQAGILTFPSVTVKVNGQTIATAPQKISVSSKSQKNNSQNQQPRGRPQFQDPFADDDDMFTQLMQQRQKMVEELQRQMMGSGRGTQQGPQGFGGFAQNQPPASRQLDVNTNEAFFILLEADKKQVYEGEQVTAQWYLYTRGQIESLDRAKFPDLKGFWKEIIEEVPTLQFQEEYVNGVLYRKALLASHALFPIKAGVAAIDEFKIKAKVRLPSQFGWGSLNEYTKASRRQTVDVKPLPTEGRPLSFSGAVGQFQIQTQIEGTSFPQGQPISLKVRFEGSGNAKLIELPPIDWPADLEVYDTRSESKFYKNGQSYKEFEVLVVAKKQGEVAIPQINFSYFDPESKSYVTKSTETFKITITAPVSGANTQALKAQVNGVANENNEKVFLPQIELSSFWSFWKKNRLELTLIVISSFFVFYLLQLIFQVRKLLSAPLFKTKVQAKLKALDKAYQEKNEKQIGAEAVNLLYVLAAELAQVEAATFDWTLLVQKMPFKAKENFSASLTQLFDYFQLVGFAPDELKRSQNTSASLEDKMNSLKKMTEQILKETHHS